MPDDFFDIIFKSAQLSIFIPLIVAIYRFRSLNKIKIVLLVLLCIGAIISILARYLWHLRENNLFLLHYYTVIEFLGWAAIYYLLFQQTFAKRLILLVGSLFVIFAILNSIFWQELDSFNSYSRSLESSILVAFSIGYYFKLFKEKIIFSLERDASFWINAAALVYFSGSFLLFGFSNLLLNLSSHKIKEVWVIHGLFLMIHYVLLTIGIWNKSIPKTSH